MAARRSSHATSWSLLFAALGATGDGLPAVVGVASPPVVDGPDGTGRSIVEPTPASSSPPAARSTLPPTSATPATRPSTATRAAPSGMRRRLGGSGTGGGYQPGGGGCHCHPGGGPGG